MRVVWPDAVPPCAQAWHNERAGHHGLASAAQGRRRASSAYAHIISFCKSARVDDSRQLGQMLTPLRDVGAAEVKDEREPFEEKIKRLAAELKKSAGTARPAREAHLG